MQLMRDRYSRAMPADSMGDSGGGNPVVAQAREVAAPKLLDVSRLNGWASQWDRLVDSSSLPSPFLRSWWLSGTAGKGGRFLLVVDGTQLLGGLAVEQHHPLSAIRIMGDGALCPDHVDLLADPGHESVVVDTLRKWLCRPGSRLFDFKGVPADSLLMKALPGRVRREPMPAAPFVRLPETAGEYRATLSSQFRRNLRKAAARLASDGVEHRTIRGPAVLSSLEILRELHEAQWEGRSGFLPVFPYFVAACAGAVDADEVVVHHLAAGDLVVATVLAFEVAGRVSLYQGARLTDTRWRDAKTILLASIIDDACARSLHEVDFLRGEQPYKTRFTATDRQNYRLVAAQGALGRIGALAAITRARITRALVRGVRFGRSVRRRWRP